MATTFRWTLGALAVVLLIGSQALAQAQRQAQQVQPGQQRTALRPAQGGESTADHQIATWLVLSNELEVNLGQLAEKQSQNKNVKQFAEMLSQQHRDLVNQFRQFAPDAPTLSGEQQAADFRNDGERQGQPALGARSQLEQRQTGQQTQAIQPGQQGQVAQGTQGGLPVARVCQQMAERTYQSIRQELSHKQGSDFDKAFIGCQIHEHVAMLNTLEVLKPYASAQLQQVIDQAIEPTQQHLAKAKQIGEQLWGGSRDQEKTEQGKTSREENKSERNDKSDK